MMIVAIQPPLLPLPDTFESRGLAFRICHHVYTGFLHTFAKCLRAIATYQRTYRAAPFLWSAFRPSRASPGLQNALPPQNSSCTRVDCQNLLLPVVLLVLPRLLLRDCSFRVRLVGRGLKALMSGHMAAVPLSSG